jgi:hypothetical protein
MTLHGGRLSRIKNFGKRGPQKKTLEWGEYGYERRLHSGKPWREIAGNQMAGYSIRDAARIYAVHSNRPWPIVVDKQN